jgi:hypothetical protein
MGDFPRPALEDNLIRQAKPGHTLVALLLGLVLGTGTNVLWHGTRWVFALVRDITDPVKFGCVRSL